jgi:hypothetical protein
LSIRARENAPPDELIFRAYLVCTWAWISDHQKVYGSIWLDDGDNGSI